MSTNKTMTDQLAALRKQAVNDASTSVKTKRTRPRAGAVGKEGRKRLLTGERERTAVNLTPEAREALKTVQAFLVTECGTGSASASIAMCIALEMAADNIKAKKKTVVSLYEAIISTDRRRSA